MNTRGLYTTGQGQGRWHHHPPSSTGPGKGRPLLGCNFKVSKQKGVRSSVDCTSAAVLTALQKRGEGRVLPLAPCLPPPCVLLTLCPLHLTAALPSAWSDSFHTRLPMATSHTACFLSHEPVLQRTRNSLASLGHGHS